MRSSVKLSKTVVDAAEATVKDYFIWDRELAGFGLKVSKGGRKSYVCSFRVGSGRKAPKKRVTIGAHGSPWTTEEARREAKKILGRAANGEDPSSEKQRLKDQVTVAELCDEYLKFGCSAKKASTIATDRGRIERHIKPLIGSRNVCDIARLDVMHFMKNVADGKTASESSQKWGTKGSYKVTGGRGTASRTVGLLGGVFSYAIEKGILENNPVHGVKRYPDKKGERFLTPEELKRLGEALAMARLQGFNQYAIDIIQLLILTGARKNEVASLRWEEVDFDTEYLRLSDSKTGQKLIPLSTPAIKILENTKNHHSSKYVFPASSGDSFYQGTPKVWNKIRELADLQDVRLHDLRHSFASVAVSEGASLPIIGSLLGHSDSFTTQRYAHLQENPVRIAGEATARTIERLIRDSGNP